MKESAISVHLERLRHRWRLIALVTVLFAIGGVAVAVLADTTRTGTATLGVTSTNRAPEQDSLLALGYIDMFNQPAMQETLAASGTIPDDVSLRAELAAPSPLIYIVATSAGDADVVAAANSGAEILRTTVNESIARSRQQKIADLRAPTELILANRGFVPEYVLTRLEEQVNAINGDSTNEISLVAAAETTDISKPDAASTVGLALFAGLIVGCALALVVGAVSRRPAGPKDYAARTGLTVLADVALSDVAAEEDSVRPLTNRLVAESADPHSVAFTAVGDEADVWPLAVTVGAELRAAGYSVALIGAGADPAGAGGPLPALLAGELSVDQLLASDSQSTDRPDGRLLTIQSDEAMTSVRQDRLTTFVTDLLHRFDITIVAVPAATDSTTRMVISAATDSAVFVAASSRSRSDQVTDAAAAVERAGGTVLGLVLVHGGGDSSRAGDDVFLPDDSTPAAPVDSAVHRPRADSHVPQSV